MRIYDGVYCRIPTGFEWDDDKNARNVRKHGIDFEDAVGIWDGPVLTRQSDRDGEPRWVAVGAVDGREVAVVYTVRGTPPETRHRIISARRARTNEREAYRTAFPG